MSRISFNRSQKDVICLFSILFFGITLDYFTKLWALNHLMDKDMLVGNTSIGFSLTHNSGSAFSLFTGSTIFITLFALIVSIGLVFGSLICNDRYLSFIYIVIATGAIGNVVDRFIRPPYAGHGHVTDFIHVGPFPTFNIADSLITVGAIALVVHSLFVREKS